MISKDLIDAVSNLDKSLKQRKNITKLTRKDVRKLITGEIGDIKFFDTFSIEKLKEIKNAGDICVVDGSVNRIGAN